ncbi:MAG: radical SAM protein [Armatimonadota bacterium]|nr:radical SAM protein [Armatimonadota bacterium]
MRILLLSMPDVASSFDRVMRIPNLAIVSLAANVRDAEVSTLDLVLHSRNVGQAVEDALRKIEPDLVGLSAMTFQYPTARKVAKLVRKTLPRAKIVLGGYHATLAYLEIAGDPDAAGIDFIIRGEGETPLNMLIAALGKGGDFAAIPGLSHRSQEGFVHNPSGGLNSLDEVDIPDRSSRLSGGFHYFGKPFDVVETSRGCPRNCRFCCIRGMYGGSYREYPIERVVEDIRRAGEAGARGIFFSDDNINLRPERFRELCRAIVDRRLADMEFISQADVAGFLELPDLPSEMRRAGFSGVFLGIESVNRDTWRFLRKSNSWESTRKVVDALHAKGIAVAGGLIVGNPDDDADSVRASFRAPISLGLDHAIMWCLTPYPGTEVREDLMAEGLVANPDRYDRYNGFICNVSTRKLTNRQIVRLIAAEGLKLYLHPSFIKQASIWRHSLPNMLTFCRTTLEYATKAPRNRLFESRHRM